MRLQNEVAVIVTKTAFESLMMSNVLRIHAIPGTKTHAAVVGLRMTLHLERNTGYRVDKNVAIIEEK